ncbi:MAG TPA: hypothetical protein VLW25_09985, partial [Bryobacteraceae bacterium]|nr:hypothetical protein [Bryobacteraceae bacterium]
MDTARLKRIQALFLEACTVAETDRRAFLQGECGDDTELLQTVLAMVAEDARADSLLDSGVAEIAGDMLGARGESFASREFGPYRLKKVLGEGGMGVVYLAEREDLGSLVAIKILRDAWLSPARRERFDSEQRT